MAEETDIKKMKGEIDYQNFAFHNKLYFNTVQYNENFSGQYLYKHQAYRIRYILFANYSLYLPLDVCLS